MFLGVDRVEKYNTQSVLFLPDFKLFSAWMDTRGELLTDFKSDDRGPSAFLLSNFCSP